MILKLYTRKSTGLSRARGADEFAVNFFSCENN